MKRDHARCGFRLMFVVGAENLPAGASLEEVVRAAIAGGVDCVQLREKDVSDAQLQACAERLLPIARAAGVPLVVNDRLPVARALGLGLHLGQSDGDPCAAREALGRGALLGLSIETPAQVRDQAARIRAARVDYLGVGPVFATASKPDAVPALGVDGLAEVVAAAEQPVCAIGGITAANAARVLAAGACALAVVSAIASADEPQAQARALAEQLEAHAALALTCPRA